MNNNSGLMVGIVMVLIFVAGFFMGRMTDGQNLVSSMDSDNSVNEESTSESSDVAGDVPEGGTNVDASMMTPGQRQMLSSMGLDPDSITITPEMVACAEAKLGSGRVGEIQNGATPSVIEGGQLLACYSSN